MREFDLPTLSTDLVELLDELIPHLCIEPNDRDLIEAHRYSAKRELVDLLLVKVHQAEDAIPKELEIG